MQPVKKFLNRNFLLLWQGQSVSRIGDSLYAVAVLFFVKHLTGSAAAVGLIEMASTIPLLLLGPFGGTVADRRSRRNILILCDLVNGLAVLMLAGLTFFAPLETNLTLLLVIIVALVISTAGAFFNPAISASVPDLVPKERVATANSMTQLSIQIAAFIGQGTGGMLFRLLGAPILFLVNGVSYLFAAISESFIKIPQIIPEKKGDWREQWKGFKQDTVKGFHYVWKQSGLRTLVFVSAFLNFFTVPIYMLLPFYVEDTLKVTVDWYGFIVAAVGVGTMLGYIISGSITINGKTRMRLMIVFILISSTGFFLLSLVRDPTVAVILAFLDGIVSGFITVNITTLLQVTTPGDMRGRVFGLLSTIAGSMSPLAMGLTGIIADLIGQQIPLIYAVCGGVMILLSIGVAFNRSFRGFLELDSSESKLLGSNPAEVITILE